MDGVSWDPDVYARYRGPRLRPALDLISQIGTVEGPVCDLGCGDGGVGPALRARFPSAQLIGVDNSATMLDRARESGCYDHLIEADAALWQPAEPMGLIFSNAALHWLPDHDRLIPHLAGLLAPGGTLAVQMPSNFMAPSFVLLFETASRLWPDRFATAVYNPSVHPARHYLSLLMPLGDVEAWETTYQMRLQPTGDGHPVRWFTQATAMRPYLARLSQDEAARLIEAYDEALAADFPVEADGSVVFPRARLFFVLSRR